MVAAIIVLTGNRGNRISTNAPLKNAHSIFLLGNWRGPRQMDASIFTRQKRIGDMQCLALTNWRLEIPKFGAGNVDETIGGAAYGATVLVEQNELDPHPVEVPA